MLHLILSNFGGDELFANPNFGMWMFLSIGAVALFAVFIPLVTWIGSRQKEREAFYRAETFRRLGFTLTPRGYHTLGSMNHWRCSGRIIWS